LIKESQPTMLSIETVRLLATVALILGGGVILFLLHRYAKSTNRVSEEDLLILRKQEIHRKTLSAQPMPEMVAIASPIIEAEREEYRAKIEKEYGFCPPGPPLTLSRMPNMMRWEVTARAAAAADIGSLFCYLTYNSFPDETLVTSYVILRADQPNRWKHFEITHRTTENLSSIVQKHIDGPCGELILPPKGPIVEFVWKPISKKWGRAI
jgi:hypothetical protein